MEKGIYGLKIAGISSTKASDAIDGLLQNDKQWQATYCMYDDDVQWNDFELRNYDPQIGRWIQQDPYDEFANPYTGMGNDPINNVDPNGGSIFTQALFTGAMNVMNNWDKIEEKGFAAGLGFFASGAAGGVVAGAIMNSTEAATFGKYGAIAVGAAFTAVGNWGVQYGLDPEKTGNMTGEEILKLYSKSYSTVMAGYSMEKTYNEGQNAAKGITSEKPQELISKDELIFNGIQKFTYD